MVEVYSIPCRRGEQLAQLCVCLCVSGDIGPVGSVLARYHLTQTHTQQIDECDTKMMRGAVKVMHCSHHTPPLAPVLWEAGDILRVAGE